jgi:hypothetical protein
LKLSDAFKIPSHVLSREVGDEIIVLDLASGTYFGLDPVGARIWKRIEEGETLAQVCDGLVAEYETDLETLQRDTLELVGKLSESGLLTRD